MYPYNTVQQELFWTQGLNSHIYYRNGFRYFDYGGVFYDNENTPTYLKGYAINMKFMICSLREFKNHLQDNKSASLFHNLESVCIRMNSHYSQSLENEICTFATKYCFPVWSLSKRFPNYQNALEYTQLILTLWYLAMLDFENGKEIEGIPQWPGKLFILNDCKCILIDDMTYDDIAVMHSQR